MDRIGQLESLLRDNPRDSFISHALALEYIKASRLPEALRVWEELLQTDPRYLAAYYQLGKLREASGDKQGALEAYRRGMEVATEAGDTHTYQELKSVYEASEDG